MKENSTIVWFHIRLFIKEISLACKCYPTVFPCQFSPIHQQSIEASFQWGNRVSLNQNRCPFHFTHGKLKYFTNLCCSYQTLLFPFLCPYPLFSCQWLAWKCALAQEKFYNGAKWENVYDWIRWCMSQATCWQMEICVPYRNFIYHLKKKSKLVFITFLVQQ